MRCIDHAWFSRAYYWRWPFSPGHPVRNLFLLLLLANLLLLAWQRWVMPPPAEDAYAPTGARSPQLALLAPTSPPDEAQADGPGCVRIGPFEDPAVSREAADRLAGEDLDVFRYSESGEIWVGHWVQVIDLNGREEAEAALDRLAEVGRSDAYIVRGEDGYRISLGVFRSLEGADSVANEAVRAGLTTLTTDRFRTGTEYWLLVDERASGLPDLAVLGLSGQDILRSEPAPCRDGGDGGPERDSLESAPSAPE
jgi:hypothetical protein